MSQDNNFQNGQSGLNVRTRLIANANDAEARLTYLENLEYQSALDLIAIADVSAGGYSYVNGVLNSITYTDGDGITNHTKNFTFTNGQLTQKSEVFTYKDEVWTITTDYTFSSGLLNSKIININRVPV